MHTSHLVNFARTVASPSPGEESRSATFTVNAIRRAQAGEMFRGLISIARSTLLICCLVDTVRRADFIIRLSNAPTAKRENNAKAPALYRCSDAEADNGVRGY